MDLPLLHFKLGVLNSIYYLCWSTFITYYIHDTLYLVSQDVLTQVYDICIHVPPNAHSHLLSLP